MVKVRIQTIQKTREAYLQAESDEKIRTAINRKADPVMPRIDLGEEVLYYRDGQKDVKDWHGPARLIDKSSNEFTLKCGKQIISAHPRDVRKFRNCKNLFDLAFEEMENIPNQMIRNEEQNPNKPFVIKCKEKYAFHAEKFANKKCELCNEHGPCMLILAPKYKKAKEEELNTLHQITNSSLKLSYCCISCIDCCISCGTSLTITVFSASRFQILLVENLTKEKSKYKLEMVTGDFSEDILFRFITTAQQYGFQVKTEKEREAATNSEWENSKISFQKGNRVLVPESRDPCVIINDTLETFVLQQALDKLVHIHAVLRELKVGIHKSTALTDNLSLRRCVYSGRPTKEERLKEEMAIVRDIITTGNKAVR